MRWAHSTIRSINALLLLLIALIPVSILGDETKSEANHHTYRAQQLDKLNDPVSLYRIVEHIYPDSLLTEIFMCRLDLIKNYDTAAAYTNIGSGRAVLAEDSEFVRDSLKTALLASPMAQSVKDHEVVASGKLDTIMIGTLPIAAHRYHVVSGGVVEFRMWIHHDFNPFGDYLLMQCLEESQRNSGFVASEQFRRMLNLLLLRGVEYPPGSGEIRDDLVLVRFDTRDDAMVFVSPSTVFESILEEVWTAVPDLAPPQLDIQQE